ncbi:MAG: arsenosugar biosynthesis radical SAM protein ArsS [candidate division NC10 bacterium]|nr:arsenosugar biosynthesis radical SAM protein ArsS [candidate division NC10 bacterium]
MRKVRETIMNDFEKRMEATTGGGLQAVGIETLQVNVGFLCNQQCLHCHLNASPRRTEMMEWPTMELILQAAKQVGRPLIDITGGAPELNPHLRRFLEALSRDCHRIQVRTNLTALLEAEGGIFPALFRDHQVQLVASLPCYTEEKVRDQRGIGVYEKSIQALGYLNSLGYGIDPSLPLNLVYNPEGAFLPPEQSALEDDYRRELGERFGIQFSHLLTLTNMPIGRFLAQLRKEGQEQEYLDLLQSSFNEQTIDRLMCRHQISVAWDGRLFDCDFNLALGQTVDHGAPDHIRNFDLQALSRRRIVTGHHCFACTAGHGSSCEGSLL